MAKKKYAIISQQKRKSREAVEGVWAENERKIIPENADPKKSKKNITLIKNPYDSYFDFVETKRRQIQEANKKRKRKSRMVKKVYNPESDTYEYQAMMMDFVFTHSPDAMSEAESVEYLKLALDFLKQWFKNHEIILSEIHLDETTPHMHAWLSFYNDAEQRFDQRNLRSSRKTDIGEIRKGFQKFLKGTKFEKLAMQDGAVVGKRHDGEKADPKIGKARKIIKEKNATLKEVDAKNKELRKQLNGKKEADRVLYGRVEAVIKSLRQQARARKLTINELNDQVASLSKMIEGYKAVEKENDTLKADLARAEVALEEKDAQIAAHEAKKSEKVEKDPLTTFSEALSIPVDAVREFSVGEKIKEQAEIILDDVTGHKIAVLEGESVDNIGYGKEHKSFVERLFNQKIQAISTKLEERIDDLFGLIDTILGRVQQPKQEKPKVEQKPTQKAKRKPTPKL